jgi:hypothetical protein
MINKQNIAAYIDFLHQQKYFSPAPQELKNNWSYVLENDIPQQLDNLYKHWNMSFSEVKSLEQTFLQNNTQSTYNNSFPNPQSFSQTNPQPNYNTTNLNTTPYLETPKKRNVTTLVGVVVAIAILGAAVAYLSLKGDNDEVQNASFPPASTATSTNTQPTPPAAAPTEATATPLSAADIEQEKTQREAAIRTLLNAEEERNWGGIAEVFAPKMQQYWDIKNPTEQQLMNRYKHSWEIMNEAQHKDIRITRIAQNTYDLYATFEYYSIKDDVYKSVPVHTRYVFNDSGKVIRTFGVK